MNAPVYLYVFDTLADWEISYVCAELNSGRYFKKGLAPYKMITVGVNKKPVVTMGGLTLLPDADIDEIRNPAALILPGGETWHEAMHDPVLEKAEKFLANGAIVAGICGATVGLSNAGLLDARRHTSNDQGYLKAACPYYKGENLYVREPAVTDGNLITASGTAPLEFALHIFRALGVFTAATLDAWYNLYKTQDAKYFFKLMDSVNA